MIRAEANYASELVTAVSTLIVCGIRKSEDGLVEKLLCLFSLTSHVLLRGRVYFNNRMRWRYPIDRLIMPWGKSISNNQDLQQFIKTMSVVHYSPRIQLLWWMSEALQILQQMIDMMDKENEPSFHLRIPKVLGLQIFLFQHLVLLCGEPMN